MILEGVIEIRFGCLGEGYDHIILFHEQQAKGSGAAVAGHGRRSFLYIDPFKGTVLLDQILDVPDLLGVHSRISNK